MATKKITPLSEGAKQALEMLKEGCRTAAEIKAKGFAVNSAHLTVLVKRGYATSEDTVIECEHCGSKRKAKAYTLTEKGKAYEGE